jgi:23S rRNA (uracil747-C5)-methyltransferase
VKFVVSGSLENIKLGTQGSDIRHCPLHHGPIDNIVEHIECFIQMAKLSPYDIHTKTGELKGIILYSTEGDNHIYIRFILRSRESLDRIKKHLPKLRQSCPTILCISANIQPIHQAILEGPEEIFLTSQDFIPYNLGPIQMKLDPQGFVQTNQKVAHELYSTAAHWARELNIHSFAELFSGQGAFSFFMAPIVEKAIGIEINPDAVKRANQVAMENNLHHLQFIAKDASLISSELKNFSPELVLINPPRRGLGEALSLFKSQFFPYLIYSSCNAETLAQDLFQLKHYEILKIQVFDMFPHTHHFETLVLLQLTKPIEES